MTSRLKIALLGPTFPYKGGGAQHTTELAHRLTAAGHDVTLESWRAQYPSFLYPGKQTIEEAESPRFLASRRELSWRRPDSWWRAGRRLRNYDLVILVVLAPVQVPAYLVILRALGRAAATVALCHNVLPHEPRFYDRPLMRALLRRVSGALVHSKAQADLARALTDRPVRVAELPPFFPALGTDHAIRPGGEPAKRLLFFGIVRPYKGLDVLLRALAVASDQVSLIVAGEFWGGLADARALIRELGLTDRVDLRPGYVPGSEVPALFAAADALVLPYRTATASQNVSLAYEYGIPVIATRVGRFAEQVRDGVDGLICEPDDTASLANALWRFYLPGEPARLRSGVRAIDPAPAWWAYIDALVWASHP